MTPIDISLSATQPPLKWYTGVHDVIPKANLNIAERHVGE